MGKDLLRVRGEGNNALRAIDLYAGIGGWSAGLTCAGVDVVEAYEIWPAAMRTYNGNLGTNHSVTDVRALELTDLPQGISLVVGSPPCTHFSFSNRGGGGDISEGLKDVVRFFEIVRHLKPTYWIMENVPRTAAMIRRGLDTKGHALSEFRSLAPEIKILDLAAFGLPQSRSRCFVGVFPFDLLDALSAGQPCRKLGEVIDGLGAADTVCDPLWGIKLAKDALTEMEPEPPLNQEQLRMNREAKRFHPVYNDMPFPDALDRPARTVTATCTRVSRESIVVAADSAQSVRRLTVRERATLQGFPLTYQFYGISHSQKVKMIGNAVPPYFTYLVGLAAQGRIDTSLDLESEKPLALTLPDVLPDITPPHAVGTTYPARRRFRAVLPGLRFKSGMRFQLANEYSGDEVRWRVEFFFGDSKDIRRVDLDDALFDRIRQVPSLSSVARDCAQLGQIKRFVAARTPRDLQEAWRQSARGAGPYYLVDALGRAGLALLSEISLLPSDLVVEIVLASCRSGKALLPSQAKLSRNASAILAGLILGSWFNGEAWGTPQPTFQAARSTSARRAKA